MSTQMVLLHTVVWCGVLAGDELSLLCVEIGVKKKGGGGRDKVKIGA